jgi:hypothetical protein
MPPALKTSIFKATRYQGQIPKGVLEFCSMRYKDFPVLAEAIMRSPPPLSRILEEEQFFQATVDASAQEMSTPPESLAFTEETLVSDSDLSAPMSTPASHTFSSIEKSDDPKIPEILEIGDGCTEINKPLVSNKKRGFFNILSNFNTEDKKPDSSMEPVQNLKPYRCCVFL